MDRQLLKQLIKSFIPPIVYMFLSIVRGLKISFSLRKFPTIQYNSKDKKSIYILGNGPSLSKSLEKDIEILKRNDCMVVNGFATSSFFEVLQPSSYLIVDPAFTREMDGFSEKQKENVLWVLKCLIDKVNWKMTMYLPGCAKDVSTINTLSKNPHIHIVFFNDARNKEILSHLYYWLLNHNCISPLSQTVLNCCISIAITMRYSEIYLLGADTSWHENLWMDQSNNELYTIDKHFYGEEKRRCLRAPELTIPVRAHEELRSIAIALESYWILADYANYNNVKVYNSSTYSWIDAFERRPI